MRAQVTLLEDGGRSHGFTAAWGTETELDVLERTGKGTGGEDRLSTRKGLITDFERCLPRDESQIGILATRSMRRQ